MNIKKIDSQELLNDINNGLSKSELLVKYNCSGGTLLFHIRKVIPDFTFKKEKLIFISKEFLQTTELSITEIAKLYNISLGKVWDHIYYYNIDYKKNKKTLNKLSNRDWLYNEYITNNKSLLQLGKELKTSRKTIGKYLILHNISKKERYTERLSNKAKNILSDDIIKLYKSGNSCSVISSNYQCNEEYIRQILIKNNIERNSGYNTSTYEKEIQNILNELNIDFISNTKSIIYPYELDIYIKEYKIAIEINGVYFHSSKFLDKNYHENKRKICEEKGIRLIQFFEDDLIYKFDIIRKFLINIFKATDYVHARKCKLTNNISLQKRKEFMEKNHIQGYAKCNYHIGLEYNNQLVALMLFDGNILTRYATSKRVQGGFSKLIKNSGLSYIKTFVDLSMFTGKTYSKCGFIIDKYISPDYKYVINNKRIHKFNLRKKQFKKKEFKFESTLTESELAKLNNIHKIYDAGKLRLIWQK